MELEGKRVLVIGLGETGLAMAKWLGRQGARVRVADSRPTPPNVDALRAAVPAAEVVAGPFAEETFADIDLVAISPGVPVQTPQVQAAKARGVPVVSEIELFAWGIRQVTPEAKVIAITGSNGKTTTTTLTAHLLNAAGVPAVACGNISPSALDALMGVVDGAAGYPAAPAVWVLELSSFQLETTHTLNADAATVLNVSEDHLDRYTGMDDYAGTKARVFQGDGVMLLNRDDARCMAWSRPDRKTVSFGLNPAPSVGDYGFVDGWIVRGDEKLVALNALKLTGLHNAANAMAALALCEAVGVAPATLLPALQQFSGLSHRVEFVAEIDGVGYYDDSKGTNVGATLAAVQGMGRKVALILGGDGKAQDFSPLKPVLARHARAVALIGRDAELIGAAIDGCGVPVQRCGDMEEAVCWCAGQAQAGDTVLLSPACASFDMFRNYAHRAEVFIAAVQAMAKEVGR
ncbi:UDP-N-acetylmuramoyl-L-alanine--D-glutamate ligase [Propionivibrio limicola]|uniref:UDP-N-acetylmuramoyl-L-alanine--D-glutamate ligase n=1 Tax=Propionivibrio limicola TaxID=167645 RepID=UPI001292031C|nr:UDP-N-acetylmuramoyl-L-alanine--D-glutamate ligase [Propionivibrio limicola]